MPSSMILPSIFLWPHPPSAHEIHFSSVSSYVRQLFCCSQIDNSLFRPPFLPSHCPVVGLIISPFQYLTACILISWISLRRNRTSITSELSAYTAVVAPSRPTLIVALFSLILRSRRWNPFPRAPYVISVHSHHLSFKRLIQSTRLSSTGSISNFLV